MPSCAYFKEGSDRKGAVSPEREGRASASSWCFTLGCVEGFQLHLVAWEQGCLGGSKHIWECKSDFGLLKQLVSCACEGSCPLSV